MAINTNQGYTMGYGVYEKDMAGPGYAATEEERRRREAERLAAEDAARLEKLQMSAPPMVEQPGVPVAGPVEPEPIKQTITYDPVSGEQRMKIEGNARDLSAENPLTPTLTMPGAVSPEQMAQQQQMEMAAQQQEQARAQQQQMEMAAQQQEQAQAQQQMPQAQMPQPGPPVQVASAAPGLPQTQPAPQPMQQQPATDPIGMFTAAAGDTNKLLQIYNDKNQSPELRRIAGREASRMLDAETKRADAEEQVKSMSQTDIARLLKSKSEEGSWGKRVLFGLLGMDAAIRDEEAKLGIGAKWQSTNVNGAPVLVKVRADGVPMEGYDATTGKMLGNKELVGAVANMAAIKGANVGGQVYRDPVTNETLTKVDTQQGPIYYNKAQQRVIPKGEPIPLTAGSDVATQLQLTQMKRQQAFVGQTAAARIRAYQETNNERALAGLPQITPEQMGINRNGELIGQAQPQTPGVAAPQGAAPQAQAPQGAAAQGTAQAPQGAAQAPQGGAGLSGAELKAQREAKKDVAKDAAKQVAASADTQNMLASIEKVTGILDSGTHNIGPGLSVLQGRGRIAQAVGRQFETEDARNTSTVLDTVRKLASDGLKALGSNPSTVDLQFWTADKPNESSDPAYVKSWIESRAADLKRRLGYAEKQMGKGGGAGGASEVPAQPRVTTRPSVSRW